MVSSSLTILMILTTALFAVLTPATPLPQSEPLPPSFGPLLDPLLPGIQFCKYPLSLAGCTHIFVAHGVCYKRDTLQSYSVQLDQTLNATCLFFPATDCAVGEDQVGIKYPGTWDFGATMKAQGWNYGTSPYKLAKSFMCCQHFGALGNRTVCDEYWT